MSGWWLVGVALASEPTVTQLDDSWIEGSVEVLAPAERVSAVISDPAAVAAIDGTVEVTSRADGSCYEATTLVPHMLGQVTYHTRCCPSAESSWTSVLTGGQMREFDSTWSVEPTPGGSLIRYRLRSIPTAPVPQFLVNRSSVKAVQHTLSALRDHFAAAPGQTSESPSSAEL